MGAQMRLKVVPGSHGLTDKAGLVAIGHCLNRFAQFSAAIDSALQIRGGIAHSDVARAHLGLSRSHDRASAGVGYRFLRCACTEITRVATTRIGIPYCRQCHMQRLRNDRRLAVAPRPRSARVGVRVRRSALARLRVPRVHGRHRGDPGPAARCGCHRGRGPDTGTSPAARTG